MTYDELGAPAARGRGMVWDGEDGAAGTAVWLALTQQGPTGTQCQSTLGLSGRQLMGLRKQPAVPEGLPKDQLGSPRRCRGVSLPVWRLPRSLCSSPSSNMEQ